MKRILTYNDLINEENNLIKEMSLIDKELDKFNNIKDIKNDKLILKNITKKLETIREELKNIDFNEIILKKLKYYDRSKNTYSVQWNDKIKLLLFGLDKFLNKLSDDSDIYQKIKLETENLVINYLEIDIEKNIFNSIHFPIDLPDYYKNIGLGIKIFRKAIEHFNFISTVFAGEEQASFEAKMVIDHFISNDDVYSITKNNSGILLISKSLDIEKIKELVETYLHNINKNDYAIDKHLKTNKLFKNFI